MSDDEGPDWKPRILNPETRVVETTLENGVVVRMHCHFGQVDMVHFDRMCRLHPNYTLTYDQPQIAAPFSLWAMIARSVRSLMRSCGVK